jgi:nickel/cobalt transporter (NicO) family protein
MPSFYLRQSGRSTIVSLKHYGSIAVLVMLAVTFVAGAALAQVTPFGAAHPAGTAMPGSGLVGWIFAEQAAFYRSLSGCIRASKDDGAAMWGLFGISFLYGVFHAVGPGHGKAVISSYLVANEETWRRGVVLSFVSAGIQSVVAVIIVLIAAILLEATAKTIGWTVHVVEIVSYALIILIGLRLLFVKGRSLLLAVRQFDWPVKQVAVASSAIGTELVFHRHGAGAIGCGHCDSGHGFHCDGDHDRDHHAFAWGHSHGPAPAELGGAGGWRRGLSAVMAVGLRPCSGAIIVLIFALAQDLFWTGVGATLLMGLGTALTVALIATLAVSARQIAGRIASAQAGWGMLAMRAVEVGASALMIAFGALLLAGYMASEQLWMFTG